MADISKKPKSYRIGVFTVTMTVTFVILIYNILNIAPAVFLKLSEDQIGESDIVFRSMASMNISQSADLFMYSHLPKRKPVPRGSSIFVNSTKLQATIADSSYYEGATPRWIFLADFGNTQDSDIRTNGIVFIIDSKKEVEIGLGRQFSKEILGYRQAFITHSSLRYLKVDAKIGEKVQLIIDTSKYLSMDNFENFANSPIFYEIAQQHSNFVAQAMSIMEKLFKTYQIEEIKKSFILRLDFEVVDSFDSPRGKFPNSYGNVMVIDANHLLPDVLSVLSQNIISLTSDKLLSEDLQKLLDLSENIDIHEYAMQVDGVLKNREKYYINPPKVSYFC
jgi:hypothetical protein